MSHIQVDIVTPENLVFSGPARELRAPGWDGEFGILPGHDAYLALLHGGICTLITESGEQRFIVGRGFVEATQERVILLTDSCREASQADKVAAQKELAQVESEMMSISAYSESYQLLKARAEVAQAELDA